MRLGIPTLGEALEVRRDRVIFMQPVAKDLLTGGPPLSVQSTITLPFNLQRYDRASVLTPMV